MLGPSLFFLYVNDLSASCEKVSVKLYADDVKVYKVITDPHDRVCLQQALNAIETWSYEWQLDFSIDKCQFLQLGYADDSVHYCLGSAVLSPICTNKDLGFTIASNLKPSMHICNIAKRASARARLILKCFHSRDLTLLTKAYTTYVRPLLEYGSTVWNPCYIGDINTIESVQRSFTYRALLKCRIKNSGDLRYEDRLRLMCLERLELRRLYFDLTDVFKIAKGFSSQCLFSNLPLSHNTHTRGHRYKLSTVFIRHNVLKHFIYFRCMPAWNALPDMYVNTNITQCFRLSLCKFDFSPFLHGTL